MIVYHGSYTKIDKIDLTRCEIGKDFGRGFYVTKLKEQAEFWAKRKGAYNQTQGVVTAFNFNENAFQYFRLKTIRFEKYNEDWLDFVVKNRDIAASQPTHDYDIVEGPVADDKIAARITDYLNGKITKSQFLEELKFSRETHQICFCTGRSLQMLDYADKRNKIDSEVSTIGESVVAQLILDFNFDETKAVDLFFSSSVFTKLVNVDTKLHKQAWQDIYEMLKQELNL